ncbi:hypothetical protein A6X21_11265 [Planctopirus hydrillae]|uniref:Late embryogenesis abundant protein n=2 Tax=Planctopirus hydrillae TaxID=1841610 RepID=A0A1C3E6E0_9PLAN|nr:hypothetical protein A6X21_11265 [Planctopirus hydrillae]
MLPFHNTLAVGRNFHFECYSRFEASFVGYDNDLNRTFPEIAVMRKFSMSAALPALLCGFALIAGCADKPAATIDKAAEGAKQAVDGAAEAAKETVEKAGEAAEAAKETTEKAAEAVKEKTGEAVEAVKDAAGKAVDAATPAEPAKPE